MGIQDSESINLIKTWIKEIDTENYFKFIVDFDTKEGRTRILIDEFGTWKKAPFLTKQESEDYRSRGFRQFVPDLADFDKKLIIEYQEESKGRTGILRRHGKINKKGHDEFSDKNKDLYYELAKFKVLKLWENSDNNKRQLEIFLKNVRREKQNLNDLA